MLNVFSKVFYGFVIATVAAAGCSSDKSATKDAPPAAQAGPAFAPKSAQEAPAARAQDMTGARPQTLVNVSGEWGKSFPLPPGVLVIPGNGTRTAFQQTTDDVVCDAANPTEWCKTAAAGYTIIISKTNLYAVKENEAHEALGTMGWTVISSGGQLSATVSLMGTYKEGTWKVADTLQADWNMQFRVK